MRVGIVEGEPLLHPVSDVVGLIPLDPGFDEVVGDHLSVGFRLGLRFRYVLNGSLEVGSSVEQAIG